MFTTGATGSRGVSIFGGSSSILLNIWLLNVKFSVGFFGPDSFFLGWLGACWMFFDSSSLFFCSFKNKSAVFSFFSTGSLKSIGLGMLLSDCLLLEIISSKLLGYFRQFF